MATAGDTQAAASNSSGTGTSTGGANDGGVVRILDLYSGVGCLHAALGRPGVLPPGCTQVQVAAAVDINTAANAVYAVEHGTEPRALDLTRVTAAQLDALCADVWLLTPPCQPYTTTTNARRKDTADPRAASLLHLASVLPSMRRPPSRLLLENVPGFAGSHSRRVLAAALAGCGYGLQEFLVSPHQLGVPYSRPRYFALAVRRPLRLPRRYDCSAGPVPHPPLLTPQRDTGAEPGAGGEEAELESRWAGVYDAGPRRAGQAALAAAAIATAANLGDGTPPPPPHEPQPPQPGAAGAHGEAAGAGGLAGDESDPWVSHAVPAALLGRFWRVLDVVTPTATYSNCFTKHYADNALGAGSVLATEEFAAAYTRRDARGRLHFFVPPPLPPGLGIAVAPAKPRRRREGDEGRRGAPMPVAFRLRPPHSRAQAHGRKRSRPSDEDEDEDEDEDCEQGRGRGQERERELEAVVVGLRFFTPEEVAALHGLPQGWAARAAAAGVGAARQQYALLGNGLSVDVAAHLLQYLFAAEEGEAAGEGEEQA
eukprot:XP_001703193.1 DNA methyltransferase [Chlamydomonas reinhardtii]